MNNILYTIYYYVNHNNIPIHHDNGGFKCSNTFHLKSLALRYALENNITDYQIKELQS